MAFTTFLGPLLISWGTSFGRHTEKTLKGVHQPIYPLIADLAQMSDVEKYEGPPGAIENTDPFRDPSPLENSRRPSLAWSTSTGLMASSQLNALRKAKGIGEITPTNTKLYRRLRLVVPKEFSDVFAFTRAIQQGQKSSLKRAKEEESNPARFRKKVSFDTVDSKPQLEDSDDHGYHLGVPDWQIPELLSRARSPMGDARMEDGNLPSFVLNNLRMGYPTRPIITHDACTLNKVHRDFDSLYMGKLGRKPTMPGRTMMIYISGRRSSWVAIDWCIRKLLEDGDTIVVAASIDEEMLREAPSSLNVARTADNILRYILAILNPNLIVRISVEIGRGHTKDILKELYKLYLPSLVITSALPKAAAVARSWVSSRLTDRLVKNFPVPVLVVPAGNMDEFELRLFAKINLRFEKMRKELRTRSINDILNENFTQDGDDLTKQDLLYALRLAQQNKSRVLQEFTHDMFEPVVKESQKRLERVGREDEVESEDSDEQSINSISSADSDKTIADLMIDSEAQLNYNIKQLKEKPMEKDYFKNLLLTVSDSSYSLGMKMAEAVASGSSGADLVRTVTDAPASRATYRSKSMLLDDGEPFKKSKSPPLGYQDVSGERPSASKIKFTDASSAVRSTDNSDPNQIKAVRSLPTETKRIDESKYEKRSRRGFMSKLFNWK